MPVRRSCATTSAPRSVFGRAALGKSFYEEKGLGRLWTPMVELLADRDLLNGASTDWDVLPEFQVTLSRRQHVRADFGVRIPVNHTADRPIQVMVYLLWDTADGSLLQGWK